MGIHSRPAGGGNSGMSVVSQWFSTMDVPLNSSAACLFLSVATVLSGLYRGATELVAWVVVYLNALKVKGPLSFDKNKRQCRFFKSLIVRLTYSFQAQ